MKTITFVCTIVHSIGEIKFFTLQVQGCSEETAPVEFAGWKWAYTSSNSSGKERHGGTIWRCSSVRSHARIMIIRQLSISYSTSQYVL